jgi:hypothetical protein
VFKYAEVFKGTPDGAEAWIVYEEAGWEVLLGRDKKPC